jgi:hypothetical protein
MAPYAQTSQGFYKATPASLPRRREENKTKAMTSRNCYKSPTRQKQTKQKTMTPKSTNIKHLFKWAHEAFIGRSIAHAPERGLQPASAWPTKESVKVV